MKNNNYKISILFLILSIATQSMIAQVCNSYINVSLANTGTAKIYAENVLEGSIADYSNLSWDFLTFDCSDIGENDYTISGLYQGDSFTCGGVISIEDKLGPVAICDLGVVVTVDTDTVWLTPDMVSSTSYDNCSDITSEITPLYVTAANIGQMVTTVVTITDEGGNTASCWTQILVQGEGGGSEFLSCIDLSTVLVGDESVQMYASDFLASDFNGDVTLSIVDDAQNEVLDNLITSDYIGQTLVYVLTDPLTGNTCWGQINVQSDDPIQSLACNDLVQVYVDAASSVTLEPSDLIESDYSNSVTLEILDSDQNIVPDNIITLDYVGQSLVYTITDDSNSNSCWGGISVLGLEAIPMVCNEDFDLVMDSNLDFEITANELLQRGNPLGQEVQLYMDGQEVVDNILTVDMIGQLLTYVLIDTDGNTSCGGNINLFPCSADLPLFQVCDTKSRSTIINDCIWEHTSTDNVEWPADLDLDFTAVITSNTLPDYIDMYALENNEEVDFRDVEPRIVGGCFEVQKTFNDIEFEIDGGFKVIRTWTLLDWYTSTTYTYVQIIKIEGKLASNVLDTQQNSLTLRSNPVSTELQFIGEVDASMKYQIVLLSGQLVKTGQMQDAIDVSNLSQGMYIVRVITPTSSDVMKFEIQR